MKLRTFMTTNFFYQYFNKRSSIKACITRKILKEQSQILSMMGNGSIYKAFKGKLKFVDYQYCNR